MRTKEEILARQKAYKAANKEKQKIYAKRCYDKKKSGIHEAIKIQSNIDYIKSLFVATNNECGHNKNNLSDEK